MDLIEDISKYSKKEADFIFAMLEYDNIKKSAEIAGITEQTAYNYLKKGLADDIKHIRKKYIESNFQKLEYASIKATDVIINILNDKNCPQNVKLNASKLILDYSFKIREQTEIIERLEGIEKRIDNK